MQYSSKEKYIRYIIYTGVILVASLLQSSKIGFPEILGARAFLLVPLAVCIAMHEREIPAAIFGGVIGLLWDVSSANEGFSALVLMILSAVCSILISHLMRNNIITAFVLGAGAIGIYQILYVIFNIVLCGAGGAFKVMLTFYLPSFIYTIIFIPIFYYIVKWIFESHKVA